MQEIIIYLLFAGALVYVGFRFRKMLRRKDCGGGCASCGSIDIKAIEEKIRKEQQHV
jgi:hypothetical protein